VRHRTALKNRIHATLLAFRHPCPVSDLFGAAGRRLLDGLQLPEPWGGDVVAALRLIEIRVTRNRVATSRSLAPSSIHSAASSRTRSRRARSSASSPPPSGYLMPPA
jgi:hypothetical protein